MAAVNLAAIAAALSQMFEDRITGQINRSTVLLQILPVKPGNGKNVAWTARLGTATGAVIADGADVVTFNNDEKLPAILNYGTYNDAFSISGKALAAARASGNPAELAALFEDEIGDSAERLAKKISLDLWTGSGATDNIHGLVPGAGVQAIGPTGIYAGIDRGTYSQWAGNALLNGGVPRALTLELMRQMREVIYVASGMRPDVIVCSPALHRKYGSLMQQERRWVDQIRMRGETIKLDGGYSLLEFDGVPVIEDVDAVSDKMVFLNTNFVAIRPLPDETNAVNMSPGLMGVAGTAEEQYGEPQRKLTARINPLARTGDANKFQLICYPQQQVRRPNSCGYIGDLDPAL